MAHHSAEHPDRWDALDPFSASGQPWRLIPKRTRMSSKVVSVHDDAGCIQFYSRRFLNLLGYEAKDIIGQALINLVHSRSKRAARAGVDRMRRHQSTFDAWTFQFVTASGDAVWLDGLASNFLRDPRLGGIMVYWTPRPTGSSAPSR